MEPKRKLVEIQEGQQRKSKTIGELYSMLKQEKMLLTAQILLLESGLEVQEGIHGFFEDMGFFTRFPGDIKITDFQQTTIAYVGQSDRAKDMVAIRDVFNVDPGVSFFYGKLHGDSSVSDVRLSADLFLFATASVDKTVKLWNFSNISEYAFEMKHNYAVMSVDFHPSRTFLCSCDSSGVVMLWDYSRLCGIGSIKDAANLCVRFNTSGQVVAGVQTDGVGIYRVPRDEQEPFSAICLQTHHHVHSFTWDKSGALLASLSDDSAKLWRLHPSNFTLLIEDEICVGDQSLRSCAFDPIHEQILIIGAIEQIILWDGKHFGGFKGHNGIVTAMASSVSTELIATSSEKENRVKLWKLRASPELKQAKRMKIQK